jgi:hypothetical protein
MTYQPYARRQSVAASSPEGDIPALENLGVREIFTSNTITKDIVDCVREKVEPRE